MSSAEQCTLVDDPDLPGLGLLLADDPLKAWLAERGEVLHRRCYLRYKPRTSCVVGVRLASGPAFLIAVSLSAQPKLEKYLAKARPGDMLGIDLRRSLLCMPLAADRDLPALADLDGNVERLLGASSRPARTLVHKPQRRWVGLACGSEPATNVVLRGYRRQQLAHAGQGLQIAQRAAGALRVPRLLARSSRAALLAVTFLPGTSLDSYTPTNAGHVDLAAVGEALAQVHGCEVHGIPESRASDLGATAALVKALVPHLADRVADLAARLSGTRPSGTAEALCHGDFSLDQVVVDDQGALGLIDWDRAGRGEPAADVASAIAAGLDATATSALLAGYSRVRAVPQDLDWQLASARLRRLAEPFRLASPNWLAELEHGVQVLESTMP